MKLLVLFLTILFFSISSIATEESYNKNEPNILEKTQTLANDSAEQITSILDQTRILREKSDYFALGNYSSLDLLIPNKFGVTVGEIKNADKTYEFEYLRGSIAVPFIIEDLGKMTDERYSLIARSYMGNNSFNFSYGLSYFDFSLHIGDKLLNRITSGTYPAVDLVQVQSLGFNLGLGNRWAFSHNITLGVDWISWAQPVYVTNKKSAFLDFATNQQDRDDVDQGLKIISYFPRFALLKVQFGMLF